MKRKSPDFISIPFINKIFTSHNIGVLSGNVNDPFKYNGNVLFIVRFARKR